MYTCSLEGCKSAWGDAEEMYNHLVGNKMKHNKNYLQNVEGNKKKLLKYQFLVEIYLEKRF
jgi:ribosomal protein S15P/S13E